MRLLKKYLEQKAGTNIKQLLLKTVPQAVVQSKLQTLKSIVILRFLTVRQKLKMIQTLNTIVKCHGASQLPVMQDCNVVCLYVNLVLQQVFHALGVV